MKLKHIAASLGALMLIASSAPAFARCSIKNETKYDFTIESGNVSGQRVGPNTSTSIAPGKIIGKSKDGKSVGGSCKSGDQLIIKDYKGVPILEHK